VGWAYVSSAQRKPAFLRANVASQDLAKRGIRMKNCNLCKLSRVCNDLPGFCILMPYLAVAVVAVTVGYLFLTQEILA
jgi:hypothetical protein